MDVALAVNALLTLTSTLAQTVANVQQVSAIIQKAQAEGRTTLTQDEWATVQAVDQASRAQLLAAIQKALGA